MTLLESIREKAAKAYKHIVLAEGEAANRKDVIYLDKIPVITD